MKVIKYILAIAFGIMFVFLFSGLTANLLSISEVPREAVAYFLESLFGRLVVVLIIGSVAVYLFKSARSDRN